MLFQEDHIRYYCHNIYATQYDIYVDAVYHICALLWNIYVWLRTYMLGDTSTYVWRNSTYMLFHWKHTLLLPEHIRAQSNIYDTISNVYCVYIVTYMLIKSLYMMIHEDMDYFIEYNLYAVTYMYQNPTYVVRVFHSSSDSSVDASPTVKQRFTGLSVPGSDNKEMITRFLFLFTASPGRYSMVSSLSSPTSCNYMHGCHTRTIYVGFV